MSTPSKGLWTTARNFLRPFRGVHKKWLPYYLAMCEHKINLKRINPKFISQLVAEHRLVTLSRDFYTAPSLSLYDAAILTHRAVIL